ncbi:alpha/beta hydrolase [Pedobacter sp. PAMC26386]|nr:alpha/beta hydrolase [Pedobacter sp. PAMC26386]
MKLVSLKLIYGALLVLGLNFETSAYPSKINATYVLVHGAFHGGWCWKEVAKELRSHADLVYTPTLSGLGEHKNTLDTSINLNTHINDIVNLILMEDLHDVILVGHSYAGAVIAGVADRIPERLSQLVFLDALIVANGQSVNDLNPGDVVEEFKKAAFQNDKGLSIPVLKSEFFGVKDPKVSAWANERLTSQPYRSFSQPLYLKHPFGNHIQTTYICCTGPELRAIQRSADIAKNKKDWKFIAIKTGHDAMLIEPAKLSKILESLN